MFFKDGCIVCGKELEYSQEIVNKNCFDCGQTMESNVCCPDGHFICDSCHSSSANDLIENFCINTSLTDPVEIALIVMRHKQIMMHGPEHHFLVPAVLLSAYFNMTGEVHKKRSAIQTSRKRAESVLGGFCGTHGNCGAAVGTGIFISVITKATPLSESEWQLSNTITGKSLLAIAEQGGPRCCKRDSFTSIRLAIDFLQENFDISLPKSEIICEFGRRNKQCKFSDCQFFKAS